MFSESERSKWKIHGGTIQQQSVMISFNYREKRVLEFQSSNGHVVSSPNSYEETADIKRDCVRTESIVLVTYDT